jgi:hypothetical protein
VQCRVKRLTSSEVNKAQPQLPQGEELTTSRLKKDQWQFVDTEEACAQTFLESSLDHDVNGKQGNQ